MAQATATVPLSECSAGYVFDWNYADPPQSALRRLWHAIAAIFRSLHH